MTVELSDYAQTDENGFRGCLEESYLRKFPVDMCVPGRPKFAPERSIVARDRSLVVGTTSSYELLIETPVGVQVPAAGISLVSVLPTHRGQGIMSSLLTEQLRRLRESHIAFAALWASHAGLYPRYGFGLAVPCLDLAVPSRTSFVDASLGGEMSMQFCSVDDALEIGSQQYERVSRPGRLAMDTAEWQRRRGSLVAAASGMVKAALAVDDGAGPLGVVIYSVEAAWVAGEARGRIDVHELLAANGDAYAAVWRFLLDQDWVSEIRILNRPVDEPLLALASNPRALSVQYRDALFLRILDVGRSLQARTYGEDIECVLRVRDRILQDNEETWVLTVTGGVGECVRVPSATPQVTLSIDALGAAFLGGVTFASLAGAGRLRVHDDAAVRALDRAFGTHLAPHCPFIF